MYRYVGSHTPNKPAGAIGPALLVAAPIIQSDHRQPIFNYADLSVEIGLELDGSCVIFEWLWQCAACYS
jgi:hypothetical protein